MTSSPQERQQAWRAIGIFMLLLIAISAVFDGLMANMGRMTSLTVTGVMWAPGIAAMATCLIMGRSIRSLPWGWGAWKWNWRAYWVPAAYGLAIYLPIWLFGLGGSGFPNQDTLAGWSTQVLGEGKVSMVGSFLTLAMLATLGVIGSCARALGEEIGWRGFLIWEMRKVMSFEKLALLSGLIWGIWHWPAILFTDYNAGDGNFYVQMLLFTISIAAAGVLFAYFTFKSKSLWPAVILHASHNLFIQAIYTPLTVKGPATHEYIDEFGLIMPLVMMGLALYVLRRARKEGL